MLKRKTVETQPAIRFSDYYSFLDRSFQEAIDSLWGNTQLDEEEINIFVKKFYQFFNALMEDMDVNGCVDVELVKDYIRYHLDILLSKLREEEIDVSVIQKFEEFRSLLVKYSGADFIEA